MVVVAVPERTRAVAAAKKHGRKAVAETKNKWYVGRERLTESGTMIKKSKEPITSREWVKRAERLKDSYKNTETLLKTCDEIFGEYYALMIYSGKKLVGVYPANVNEDLAHDHRFHTMRDILWYMNTDGKLQRLESEKMIDALVERFKSEVDISAIIRDRLYDSNPDEIDELFERAIVRKGTVNEKEGCYKLVVGGKRGKPYEFNILD